jgi:outer membrane immunogenic protein
MRGAKWFVLAMLVGSVMAGIGVSRAADLAARPYTKAQPVAPIAYSWTGFYFGINGGYGWNSTTGDQFCTTPAPASVVGGVGCSASQSGTLKPNGGIFGAEAGYNFQTGKFVWGIETDIQWSGIKASASALPVACCIPFLAPNDGTLAMSQNLNWFGTFRGRLGITAWDRGLLYATGGLIYGQESVSQRLTFPVAPIIYPASASSTRTGWTLGAGLEHAFTQNLSGKIEGLYYDMGSQTIAFVHPLLRYTASATFDYRGSLVRAGLNYRFGGPVVARY